MSEEPTVFVLASGALLLSAIVDNRLRQLIYGGYTKEEALELFASPDHGIRR
tara:strand:- start:125 stop:280 length:156 start_codon:yes stop_codon:yes gene_type:complete